MTVQTFLELKDQFNNILEKSKSHKLLIDNEISQIENYLNQQPTGKKIMGMFRNYPEINKKHQIFYLDISALSRREFFDAFYNEIQGVANAIEKYRNEQDEAFNYRLKVIEQARELVNYYKWLKELSIPKLIKSKSSLTHKQKVLALHYLGLQFKDHDYLQIARLIEPIINVGANDSRKYVQILAHEDETLKTKENLSTLLHMFDKESFTEQTKKIKRDLEKLE